MEVGLLKPSLDQGFIDRPLQGPAAALIKQKPAAAETFHCKIQQRIGRAAVPSPQRSILIGPCGRGQQGQVGNASEVQQGTPAPRWCHKGGVSQWHEGGALATSCQISAAKVVDHRLLQEFR